MDAPFPVRLLENPIEGARHLLGAVFVRTLEDGVILKARIVETEAYHQSDPASHTYKGISARNAAMFGPAGHAYVYLSYGMHWCLNVTAGKEGEGAGVLIRAVEPLQGIERMRQLRGDVTKNTFLTNGPGKLGQALAIDMSLYGHDLSHPPLQLTKEPISAKNEIRATTRIGISKAADMLMRFYIKNNPYVSKP